MAVPALRQPKLLQNHEKTPTYLPPDKSYVIVTLKGDRKLVISADAYNGILCVGGFYKCVFCETILDREQEIAKEKHIRSAKHSNTLEKYPHMNEYSHNLIRKLNNDSTYFTICNVIVENLKLMKHICSEAHLQELDRADARALTYKAYK